MSLVLICHRRRRLVLGSMDEASLFGVVVPSRPSPSREAVSQSLSGGPEKHGGASPGSYTRPADTWHQY